MPKVYLSPAYHAYNPCALPGCDETTHNNQYLDQLEPYLTACGIDFLRGPRRTPRSNEDGGKYMEQAVAQSNRWGADVHYVSHTNAFDGSVRGYRPMIYPGSVQGRHLAQQMMARRRAIYDGAITLVERADLYELRATKAVAYYEEHVFHDNEAEARWFHDNLRAVAESAARGLCDYFGIPFVDPYAAPADAPAGSAPAGDAVPLPQLSEGSSGRSVRALQILLTGYGYSAGAADGIFGPNTAAALRRYQQAAGLSADGIAGPRTWRSLLTE